MSKAAKDKVIAVYPDAWVEYDYNVGGTHSFRYWIAKYPTDITPFTNKASTPEQAWQNALKQIENENNRTNS